MIGAIAVLTALGKLMMWIGGVNEHKSTVTKFMETTDGKLDKLLDRIPAVTVAKGSPLRLTELGEEIAVALDALSWASQAAEQLRDRVDTSDPHETQAFSSDFIHKEFEPSDELRRKINRCAYDQGIKRRKVLDVVAIALRDELALILRVSRHTDMHPARSAAPSRFAPSFTRWVNRRTWARQDYRMT